MDQTSENDQLAIYGSYASMQLRTWYLRQFFFNVEFSNRDVEKVRITHMMEPQRIHAMHVSRQDDVLQCSGSYRVVKTPIGFLVFAGLFARKSPTISVAILRKET